ncbi:60S ribosomal protein L18 [Conglomerata obtusa]
MRLVTTRKKKTIKPRDLHPISPNTQLRALSDLFMKIQSNTSHTLIQKISKKLRTTRSNMVPVKLSMLKADQINVVVAKVLDEDRCVSMPAVTVVALKISKEAQEKVERFGGKVYKLDELFKLDLARCVLVSSDPSTRKKCRYYGSAGDNDKKKGPKTLIKRITKQKDVTKRPS